MSLPERMSAAESDAIRARQAARARVLAFVLVGLAVLFFAITVVKVGFAS